MAALWDEAETYSKYTWIDYMIDNIGAVIGWCFVMLVLIVIWYTISNKIDVLPLYEKTLALRVQERTNGQWILTPSNHVCYKEHYWLWPPTLKTIGWVDNKNNRVYVYKHEYLTEIEKVLPTLTPVLDVDPEELK